MRARTALRLRIIGGVTVVAAALGAAFESGPAATPAAIAGSALIWALNGLVISTIEILLQAPEAAALRRLPLASVLALRVAIYGAVFVGNTAASASLLRAILPEAVPVGDSVFISTGNLLLYTAVSVAFNFVFVLRRLLGGGTLIALLTGRYHRPRREQRIVAFLDLRGSTALAERLGDEAFHRFLNRVFADLTDPVLDSGGEIYRYVGDEIIVTWPFAAGARNADAIGCCFAIAAALSAKGADYRRVFDAEPHLRCALHAGPLIVGEMGDTKREIVMLGDTMNTAARIEETCRTTGRDVIASLPLLRGGTLPPGVRAEPLGEISLRGKGEPLALFALSPSGQSIEPGPPGQSATRREAGGRLVPPRCAD